MKIVHLLTAFILLASSILKAQSSADIYNDLLQLRNVKRVLYVAAHPDDENTRLIAYLSKAKHIETAYLSLTRGDGGQNLIGSEKGAFMGIVRTQELREARKVDGGKQFFTRAVDFGFSKNFDETLEIWNKDSVFADVVWVIRNFKPEVIITRFPPNNYGGHGHHSSSAILAIDAYKAAADSTVFPEQLKYVSTWQVNRVYHNTSTWWYKDLADKVKENPTEYATLNVGEFSPVLGVSYTEIAAESRSQHKSQGFGTAKSRGTSIEYFSYLTGQRAENLDLFSGLDFTWSSIPNTQEIQNQVEKVIQKYEGNFTNPSAVTPELVELYKLLTKHKNASSSFFQSKIEAVKHLILQCNGVWFESTASNFFSTANQKISITHRAINRSATSIKLKQVKGVVSSMYNAALETDALVSIDTSFMVHPEKEISQHYWLTQPYDELFHVANQQFIGLDQNLPAYEFEFEFQVNDVSFSVKTPLEYKHTDRAKGELYQPFVIAPKATATLTDKVIVSKNGAPKKVEVLVKCFEPNFKGSVKLNVPNGFSVQPQEFAIETTVAGEEKLVEFTVESGSSEGSFTINPVVMQNGKNLKNLAFYDIQYDHIEPQLTFIENSGVFTNVQLQTKSESILYIKGAGDEIPQNLMQIGYSVRVIEAGELLGENLAQYDAVISGIRTYNTQNEITFAYDKLMDYVKNGGVYVVQYNTSYGLLTENIGPYGFTISRERVTREDATPTLLNTSNAIWSKPNKITVSDFDGWVQERGLYFSNEWDGRYTSLIAWNDPNEEQQQGALLLAEYGKGKFVFTGISFFRQLPAGVPGAYKLFVNLIEKQ